MRREYQEFIEDTERKFKQQEEENYLNSLTGSVLNGTASKNTKSVFFERIKQVYITFLSMETKETMQKMYSNELIDLNKKWLLRKMSTVRTVRSLSISQASKEPNIAFTFDEKV